VPPGRRTDGTLALQERVVRDQQTAVGLDQGSGPMVTSAAWLTGAAGQAGGFREYGDLGRRGRRERQEDLGQSKALASQTRQRAGALAMQSADSSGGGGPVVSVAVWSTCGKGRRCDDQLAGPGSRR